MQIVPYLHDVVLRLRFRRRYTPSVSLSRRSGRPDEPICGAAVHASVYRPSGAADARAGEEGYARLHGAYPRDAGGAADAVVAGGVPAV